MMDVNKDVMSTKQVKLQRNIELCKKGKPILNTYQYIELLDRNTRCPSSQMDDKILLS
jgi:predicted transcriptional regulator